jgi:hypothetical protein
MQNIGAVLVEQRGDVSHQSLAVGAIDEKNGRIIHACFRLRHLAESCGFSCAAQGLHLTVGRQQKERRGKCRPGDARATQ